MQVQTAAERFEALRGGIDIPFAERLIGIVGIAVMIGLAVLLSYDRKNIKWRLVASGLTLQVVFGLIVLKTDAGRAFFATLGDWITGLLGFQEQGARFVFGNLVQSNVPVGIPARTGGLDSGAGWWQTPEHSFAFSVIANDHLLRALIVVCITWAWMQLIVKGLAWEQRTLGTSEQNAVCVWQHLPRSDEAPL